MQIPFLRVQQTNESATPPLFAKSVYNILPFSFFTLGRDYLGMYSSELSIATFSPQMHGWLSVVLKLRKQNARRTYVKTRRKRMCIARGNRSTDRMERHPDSSGTCFPSKRNLPQFLVGLEAAAAPAAATTIYNHENDALPVGVS